jgi:hypothetical protein
MPADKPESTAQRFLDAARRGDINLATTLLRAGLGVTTTSLITLREPHPLAYFTPPTITPVKPARAGVKIGRNDPCPCGSNRKFKKCCMPA